MIRNAKTEDAIQICDIYNYYVTDTIVTFEEEPVGQDEMKQRIEQTVPNLPWIVFEKDRQILGYAYASEWKSRCAYRHSAESTVYLRKDVSGKGIGSRLYQELLNRLTQAGYHAIIGGIALPNDASVALHEKFGFKKVAQFKEVGYKFDAWIDVGYWELLL